MTNVFLTRLGSPIGRIELTGDDDAVTSLSIERDGALPHDGVPTKLWLLGHERIGFAA